MTITAKELALTNTLRMTTEALTLVTAERDGLKEDLIFVERWANHHGTKSCHSAESILGVIQHHPAIKAITKSYADGVLPTTPDPYAENEAQRKVLEQALEALDFIRQWGEPALGVEKRNEAITAIQGVLK